MISINAAQLSSRCVINGEQAAQFDPRVKSVDEVSVTYGTDNTAQVRAKITLFGKTGASEFVFPNFVIE